MNKLKMEKLAKRIDEKSRGLYKLTSKDVENIELALRLRIEACLENDDYKAAARWRRTWEKFR